MNTEPNTTTTPALTTKPAPVAKPNGAVKPIVKAAPKAKPAPKAKKEPASNVVTLAELCKEAKVNPKDARVKLRASKLKKSASSWEWPKGSAALKEAKKVITAD